LAGLSALQIPPVDMGREHLFWLRIMRDHAQFQLDTLAYREIVLIDEAQRFYQHFDRLLQKAQAAATAGGGPIDQLNREAAQATIQFRAFKLRLIDLQLACRVTLNLPPVIILHMAREAKEYLRVLGALPDGPPNSNNQACYLLHEHLLWLPDNADHAALLRATLDSGEAMLDQSFTQYKNAFDALYLKALEINGLLKEDPRLVPALIYLTRQSAEGTQKFRRFLEEYRDLRSSCQALATAPPLLPDHMAREAAYYLEKLGAAP